MKAILSILLLLALTPQGQQPAPTVSDKAALAIVTEQLAQARMNSWVDFGAGVPTGAYAKDEDGWVVLRGAIKNGAVGTVAFTLPAGFRPPNIEVFSTVSNNTPSGVISIGTGGDVTITAGNNASVWLSGIRYQAA